MYTIYMYMYMLHALQSVGGENVPWRVSEANKEYGMCETYPPILGVPASVSDEALVQASQFRSKGRMPVSMTHTHTHTHTHTCAYMHASTYMYTFTCTLYNYTCMYMYTCIVVQ